MNSSRKIVFWVIILVLVIGGGVVLERTLNKGSLKQGKSQKILPFSPEDVIKLWVVTKDTKLTIAKTVNEGWRYVGIAEIACDKKAVESLISSVLASKYDAVLFEDPSEDKLKELGLFEPKQKIGFATADSEGVILFGNKGPTNNVTYAMVVGLTRPGSPSVGLDSSGSKMVLRVHSDVASMSNKSLSELRDRSIFNFDPLNVTSLRIRRSVNDVVIIEQPSPSLWKITSPGKEAGNVKLEAVLETLYMLREARVEAFIADMPGLNFGKKPTDYGLKSSNVSVSITTRSERGAVSSSTLEIGTKGASRDDSKKGYFASRTDSLGVVLVSEDFVEHLRANSSFWTE